MQEDILALQRNLQEHKTLQAQQIQQTRKQLQSLSNHLEESALNARTAGADWGAQLENVVHEVRELRGALEVTEHHIGETETKLEQSLAKRMEALQKQAHTALSAPGPSSASAKVLEKMPQTPKEALAYGVDLGKKGSPSEAQSIFQALVKRWPSTPGVTDEALFRLGEFDFHAKKYPAALRNYLKIVDGFPRGPWADGAYYRMGVCSMMLGHLEDAQTFLSEVVAHHKKSPFYKSATSQLNEVNQRLSPHLSKTSSKKKRRSPRTQEAPVQP